VLVPFLQYRRRSGLVPQISLPHLTTTRFPFLSFLSSLFIFRFLISYCHWARDDFLSIIRSTQQTRCLILLLLSTILANSEPPGEVRENTQRQGAGTRVIDADNR